MNNETENEIDGMDGEVEHKLDDEIKEGENKENISIVQIEKQEIYINKDEFENVEIDFPFEAGTNIDSHAENKATGKFTNKLN